MNFILTILENAWAAVAVLLILGFCIFVHELGHFFVARWRGLHIDAFSIGFRKIWSKKVNGIEYRIGWLPFGGYVELPQVDAADEVPKSADGTELPRAKPVDRILTAVAGPSCNIISGLLLACIVWFTGVPQRSPVMDGIEVLAIDQAGPEYEAGLRSGDKITRVNGEKFRGTWEEYVNLTMLAIGRVELEVERNGNAQLLGFTPRENPHAPGNLKYEKISYPFFLPRIPITLLPKAGSAAELAGIRRGDQLVAVDGKPLSDLFDLQSLMDTARDQPLVFSVEREGQTVDIPVTPEPVPGITEGRYLIGIIYGSDRETGTPVLRDIVAGSPAEAAGLQIGDAVTAVNGKPITSFAEVTGTIAAGRGKPVTLAIRRGGEVRDYTITPEHILPKTVGLELEFLAYYTPFHQFRNMLELTYKSLRGMSVFFANKLGLTEQTSTIKPRHMSGPIGIGTMLFTAVKYTTLPMVIYFIVIFSFALAIFNLLPLPVLDGGHIAFALIELCLGKPLPTKIIRTLSYTFIGLLLSLMVYVTFFDLLRIYHRIAPPAADPPAAVRNAEKGESADEPSETPDNP